MVNTKKRKKTGILCHETSQSLKSGEKKYKKTLLGLKQREVLKKKFVNSSGWSKSMRVLLWWWSHGRVKVATREPEVFWVVFGEGYGTFFLTTNQAEVAPTYAIQLSRGPDRSVVI